MRWILVVAAVVLPSLAQAQGWIEPPILRPGLPVQRVERVRTSVTVRVTDRIARVEVEEWFRNAGLGLGEGDYVYALPGEAVFTDSSLFQGEEELKGETLDAARARSIYEDIVRRHRDPALIELAGSGLIRARIFPIRPGETRNVTLRYTEVLPAAGDAYRFRYVGSTRRDSAPLAFTLIIDNGSRFNDPFSPTHQLRVARDGERLVARPTGVLQGSVDVFLPLRSGAVGLSLATHRVDNEDGYFLLTLSPGRGAVTAAPRDLTVVVDVSGSMSGEKIEQARQALLRLLDTLNERDRFRLIAFSNRVDAQRTDWTPATGANVADARRWVEGLAASGGTNLAGALDEAFRVQAGAGRLPLTIVITDGQPTVGETQPDRIAARVEAAHGDARIFTFGVGFDLQTYLLERIAVAGRGTVDYVVPGEDVETAVSSLAAKITHPVLVDLAFGNAPVRLKDVQPSRLPDLYSGDELLIFGRYEAAKSDASGDLAVTGTRGGKQERFSSRVVFPVRSTAGEYIPRLWASRKIGDLMRTIRVEGSTPERVAEVRDLALRYGLLTEYTSYLVQEPQTMTGAAIVPIAAAAPPAVAGEKAVVSARLAAVRRDARTVSDVANAEAVAVDQLARSRIANERIVAGRRFHLSSGVWIDSGHRDNARVVQVAPFTRAYFDLLARLPELQAYAESLDAFTVAGRSVSIRIAADGRATLSDAELTALAAEFRGTRGSR